MNKNDPQVKFERRAESSKEKDPFFPETFRNRQRHMKFRYIRMFVNTMIIIDVVGEVISLSLFYIVTST